MRSISSAQTMFTFSSVIRITVKCSANMPVIYYTIHLFEWRAKDKWRLWLHKYSNIVNISEKLHCYTVSGRGEQNMLRTLEPIVISPQITILHYFVKIIWVCEGECITKLSACMFWIVIGKCHITSTYQTVTKVKFTRIYNEWMCQFVLTDGQVLMIVRLFF